MLFSFRFGRTALQEPVVHGDAGPAGVGATGLVEGVLLRQASSGRSASKALATPGHAFSPSSGPQAVALRDASCLEKLFV